MLAWLRGVIAEDQQTWRWVCVIQNIWEHFPLHPKFWECTPPRLQWPIRSITSSQAPEWYIAYWWWWLWCFVPLNTGVTGNSVARKFGHTNRLEGPALLPIHTDQAKETELLYRMLACTLYMGYQMVLCISLTLLPSLCSYNNYTLFYYAPTCWPFWWWVGSS